MSIKDNKLEKRSIAHRYVSEAMIGASCQQSRMYLPTFCTYTLVGHLFSELICPKSSDRRSEKMNDVMSF